MRTRTLPPSKAKSSSLLQSGRMWAMVAGFSLLWSGCTVGPDYQRPTLDIPTAYRNTPINSVPTDIAAELSWWRVFKDATLQDLIRTALSNNYDLRIATTRVEQARASAAETRSQFFPQLNYGVNTGTGKNISGPDMPSPTGTSGAVSGLDLNASWEIDLFGRIRRLSEAQQAQYFATKEARKDIMIAVITEVAQDYFQLLALDNRLRIAKESKEAFGQSLKIFQERLEGGVASKLETSSAEGLMYSSAAMVPDLERQISAQENQIDVLLGRNPQPISRGSLLFQDQELPEIPPGLPSTLVERRPDIREAEQQLRTANAQVGVAVADFFPQLNLTGLLGSVSPELAAFTGGGNLAWSMAAGVTGPIFHGGQLRAEYQRSLAARQQSVLQYQSTILNALQEVSTSLIARQKLAEARIQEERAVEAYKEAVKISFERYRVGNASYYEVLQEQQQLYPEENTLVQTKLNQLTVVVQLYRAIGGDWNLDHPGS